MKMVNFGTLLQSALVAVVLVAMVQSGLAAEKLATCCTTVNRQEITEPITGYLVQKASPPCVRAVIFQTEKGLFCSQLTAPWVRRKIIAFETAKKAQATSAAVPSSTLSLLSMITSTASPASSTAPVSLSPSSPRPSVLPTSSMPVGETLSENDDE